MRRRDFLRAVSVSSGAVVLAPALLRAAGATPRQGSGGGPYGSIDGREPDENGILLPEGFTSRVIARSNAEVQGTGYTWPVFPDGAATIAAEGGGWYLVVNSENPAPNDGGVSSIRFDDAGSVVEARSVLDGTTQNCSGGATPWGTWLSCEEVDHGQVWECDPSGARDPEVRPALGTFAHEAVAVDSDNEQLYLTEDEGDGRFYRFTPEAYPDLTAGALEVATVDGDGAVTWSAVPDPSGSPTPTREQVPDSTAFDGGEGVWFDQGSVYFATKGDDHVRRYDTADETMEVVYDGTGVLTGVDNLTIEPGTPDLYVVEDGGNMEVVVLTPEGGVFPFARIVDEGTPADGVVSEVTGPTFSPDGTRLYLASQRGGPENAGISYEVTGPFRAADAASTSTTATTLAGVEAENPTSATGSDSVEGDADEDGADLALPLVGGAMVLGLAATGAIVWRVRTRDRGAGDDPGDAPESR